MTWLLVLYPPRWRRRYGREFLELIAPQRFSFGAAIDIIGGAIDAWTQPQSYPSARAAAHTEGDTIMLAKAMRLRSAGYGATVTMRDGLKGAAVTIGGTLLSVLLAIWMKRKGVHTSYVSALAVNGWLVSYIFSMPYTTTKGWPARRQAVFIGGLVSVIAGIAVLSGLANGR